MNQPVTSTTSSPEGLSAFSLDERSIEFFILTSLENSDFPPAKCHIAFNIQHLKQLERVAKVLLIGVNQNGIICSPNSKHQALEEMIKEDGNLEHKMPRFLTQPCIQKAISLLVMECWACSDKNSDAPTMNLVERLEKLQSNASQLWTIACSLLESELVGKSDVSRCNYIYGRVISDLLFIINKYGTEEVKTESEKGLPFLLYHIAEQFGVVVEIPCTSNDDDPALVETFDITTKGLHTNHDTISTFEVRVTKIRINHPDPAKCQSAIAGVIDEKHLGKSDIAPKDDTMNASTVL
ncbi:hypothetical protein H4219_002738 [Mycoemilia scoparia]|uniref:Uncharacterized protein n=1 Tax=Mycoemilia scoparia TaxID=417184 RepID=A0A9W8A360_9FUNG|nr:hypothetical protein H4219_002738 [Mycoemilia scoparia]